MGKSLKFYGSDGVCLFKYFVSPTDPQRVFSLSILSLNLICFSIISAIYISVAMAARSSSGARNTVSKRERRGAQLQTKITLMIATTVLSWVPFGVICLLHTLDKIDATQYYKISSVILLPINSCVNPTIYSNIIVDFVNWCKAKMTGTTTTKKEIEASLRSRLSETFVSSSARDIARSLRSVKRDHIGVKDTIVIENTSSEGTGISSRRSINLPNIKECSKELPQY